MKDLYTLLPEIILYITFGYIYLHSYRATRIVKNSENYEHIIIESLVFGFIIRNIFLLIPVKFGYYFDLIGIMITCIVAGYLAARFLDSNTANKLRYVLNLKHTKHKYIWQNISDPELSIFVEVTNPETNVRYFGRLVVFEDFERNPIIQISNYQNWKDGILLNDFSPNPERTVLLDTSKYSDIIIYYQKDSEFVKSWNVIPQHENFLKRLYNFLKNPR